MDTKWRSCGEWCRHFTPGRFSNHCVLSLDFDGVCEALPVKYGQECRFKPRTLPLFDVDEVA